MILAPRLWGALAAAVLAAAALALGLATGVSASGGTAPSLGGIPQRGTVLGRPGATVTLIQFEDLACPHCAEFEERAFPTIVDDYVRPGLVKVDFRGLAFVSAASTPALRYALAASRQNRMWQLVALMFGNQSRLGQIATDKGIAQLARRIPGLNPARLVVDARSASVRALVAAHAAEAKRREIPGTPWFLVKVGAAPPKVVKPEAYDGESFAKILDEALGR